MVRLIDFVNQRSEYNGDVYAYSPLSLFQQMFDNHVNLLLRTGATPIFVFMSRLLTGYAGWFNRKYKRHGQL